MKRRRKKVYIVYAFLLSGFSIYFCLAAFNFLYINTFPEEGVNEMLLPINRSLKHTVETKFCLQLFATLYTFCEEELALIQSISSTFDVPKKLLHIDDKMWTCGLPLFYCDLLEGTNCSSSSSLLKRDHHDYFDRFPSNIILLASFSSCRYHNSGQCDRLRQPRANAVSWPILKLVHCQDLPFDDILHLIYSHYHLFAKIKFSFSCESLHIISVTTKPDVVVQLERKIPANLHPWKNLQMNELSHSRRKRSVSKSSPGIDPPAVATPNIPTRANFIPHIESTPTFSSVFLKTATKTSIVTPILAISSVYVLDEKTSKGKSLYKMSVFCLRYWLALNSYSS